MNNSVSDTTQPPASMNCINCGIEVNGNFCSQCGQRTTVKRITFREGWNDFWSRVYGFDGMFPRTLRDLTLRPGHVARQVINGNRVLYYGPVGYFFLMITLFLLVLGVLGLDFTDFMKGMQETMTTNPSQMQAQNKIMKIISDNLRIASFVIIPFQAWCARYLFFRKAELNFMEHCVLPLYTIGHIYWLSIISAVVYKASDFMLFGFVQLVLSILYAGLAYISLITYQSKTKVFFKGALLYLVSQLIMTITFIIVGLLVALLLAWLSPETLKNFVNAAPTGS